MSLSNPASSDFRVLWQKALREFHNQTGIDLEDESIPHPQDTDELIACLDAEHQEYSHDTQASAFGNILRGAIGPFNFICNGAGSTAASMFPGGSQVLAAVGVLVNASQGVSRSFAAVSNLFNRIGAFTNRLSEVSREKIPENMLPIYQAMLVSLLKICALATRLTFRNMNEVKPGEKQFWHKLKKLSRPAVANITEYARQLVVGGNAEIDGAIAELKMLVENEALMMNAVTMRQTTKITSLVVDVQGSVFHMQRALFDLQADGAEMKFEVTIVQQSLDRMEQKQDAFAARQDAAAAAALSVMAKVEQNQTMMKAAQGSQSDAILSKIDKLTEKLFGSDKSSAPAGANKKSATKELAQRSKLEAGLDIKTARKASNAIFDQVTEDRIKHTAEWVVNEPAFKRWVNGEFPLLLVSGPSGCGKTFLAGRVVEELMNTQLTSSVAHHFCSKSTPALESVNIALRVLAFGVAMNDKVYAKRLEALLEEKILEKDQTGDFVVKEEPQLSGKAPDQSAQVVGGQSHSESTTTEVANAPTDTSPGAALPDVTAQELDVNGDGAGSPASATDITFQNTTRADSDQAGGLPGPSQPDSLGVEERFKRMLQTLADEDVVRDDQNLDVLSRISRLWRTIFAEYYATAKSSQAYLVLDAVEECEELEMLALVAAVGAWGLKLQERASKLQLVLFIHSRYAEAFSPHLGSSAEQIIASSDKTKPDLDRFVHQRVSTGLGAKLIKRSFLHEVQRNIVRDSQGNFFKAAMVAEEVNSLAREDLILLALSRLPKDVEETILLLIRRLTRQLDEHGAEDLHDIIFWVASAQRPLNLAELDALLSMRPYAGRVLNLEQQMRETFSALFIVSGDSTIPGQAAEERQRRRSEVDVRAPPVEFDGDRTKGVVGEPDTEDSELRRALQTMSNATVRLGHPSLAEQLQARRHRLVEGNMPGFILLGCLDVLCNTAGLTDREVVERACVYCGAFLPEHLERAVIASIDATTRIKIGQRILQLLRDEDAISRWVQSAGVWFCNDFIRNDRSRTKMVEWLQHLEVQEILSDEDKAWVASAAANPIDRLLEGMARGCALHWLTKVADVTSDFEFLNLRDTMISTGSPHTLPDDKDYTLEAATPERIIELAKSSGLELNAAWHARVGKALREARHLDLSRQYFEKAVEADPQEGAFQTGLALTLAELEQWSLAAEKMALSIQTFLKNMERPSLDPSSSRQEQVLLSWQDLASYYEKIGNPSKQLDTYEESLTEWETVSSVDADYWITMAYTAIAYFEAATANKDWSRALKLLNRISLHPQRYKEDFMVIWRGLQGRSDQLLRLAYETSNAELLDHLREQAYVSFVRYGEDGETGRLRYSRAYALSRLDSSRHDEAIRLFETVLADDEIMDASNDYTWIAEMAQFELARLLLRRTLDARVADNWPEVGRQADKLVRLVVSSCTDADGRINFSTKDCSKVLAAWDRINNRMGRARDCVSKAINLGIEMLSDDTPDNDFNAWYYLCDALLAIGDNERAVAVVNMLRHSVMVDNEADETGAEQVAEQVDVAVNTTEGEATTAALNDSSEAHTTPADAQNVARHSEDQPAEQMNGTGGIEQHEEESPLSSTQRIQNGDASEIRETEKPAATDSKMGPPELESIEAKKVNAEQAATDKANDASAAAEETGPADANTNTAPETKAVSPSYFSCDGCCFMEILNDAPMWRCSYCIADFCVPCHELIQKGAMKGFFICGSNHDHVYIPGIPDRYPKGTILSGGQFVEIPAWVDSLREAYQGTVVQ